MQVTPWSVGCATVASILGLIGLYLDSPAATVGAAGLTALLIGQAALFLYRVACYTDIVSVERTIERHPIVVGIPVEVAVRVDPPKTEGLFVSITDIPPASGTYNPTQVVLDEGRGTYSVRFVAPGIARFRGLEIGLKNRFFSARYICTSSRFLGDDIPVRPWGEAESEPNRGGFQGTKDLDRLGIPRGEGVSGFHPFRMGDELSLIDWKLTAKHGKPYVREPTATVSGSPLLVVDLPDPGNPGGTKVLASAGEEIERMLRERGLCNLLVISGGDVIEFLRHERNPRVLFRLLGLDVHESFQPLYRTRDSVVLRSILHMAEHGKLVHSKRYASALRTNLSLKKRSPFENFVDFAMVGSEHRGVVVYTASFDEVSHLNLIAEAARRRKSRLVIRIPRSRGGFASWLSQYPVVELI